MIEKPANGRAKISQGFNSLNITIPSKKNWFIIIFMTAWMGGWVMGETFAIREVFNADTPIFANAFILIWLVGWTFGGAFVLFVILWQLFGQEIIIIERGILNIGKSIKGIGRNKQYEIKSILKIDINPTQEIGVFEGINNKNMLGIKGGKIKFDYGMKTILFANGIDEAEARMIIEKLKENNDFKEENFV